MLEKDAASSAETRTLTRSMKNVRMPALSEAEREAEELQAAAADAKSISSASGVAREQ